MTVLDASLEPPERPDFRRRGKGTPLVWNPETNKYEPYRRASSAGKILDDESQLVDWRIRSILEGAAQRPDLMAQVSVLDHDTDKREIREIAEECLVTGKGTQRRNTGTAIHAMLDHVDLDHDWVPAPQFAAAVNAYVKQLEVYGLVPVDVEVKCVNDLHRIAGTMDRRYRTTRNLIAPDGTIVPIGTVLAADTKTGQSLEYASGSYATQLAAYAGSVRYDVVTDAREEFDPPTFPDWAIIVHVVAEDERVDFYWVDLVAGRHALALSDEVREWRKRTDLITPAPAPLYVVPPAAPASPVEAPTTPVDAGTGTPAPETPAPDVDASTGVLDAVRAWLRQRVDAIRAAGDAATDALLRAWPAGVPGLKHAGHTEAQLDAISEALWNVEREWSLPFPGDDPRTPVEAPRDFSSRWSRPTGDDHPTDTQAVEEMRRALEDHPRRNLILAWAAYVPDGWARTTDRWALTHALYEFARLPDEWTDGNLTEMLDGTLRAIGYDDGINALGNVVAEHAPLIMSSAFGITAGNAMLLYGEDGKPVVRIIQCGGR